MIPLASPLESRVQGNVSGSDKEDQGRCNHQEDGNRRAIINYLVPNCSVQHENPACGSNGSDVYSGESLTSVSDISTCKYKPITNLANGIIKRKTANSKDFTDFNNNERNQEQLHLPPPHSSLFALRPPYQEKRDKNRDEGEKDRSEVGEVSAMAQGDTLEGTSAKSFVYGLTGIVCEKLRKLGHGSFIVIRFARV